MEEQWAQLEARGPYGRGPDGRSPASPYGLVQRRMGEILLRLRLLRMTRCEGLRMALA